MADCQQTRRRRRFGRRGGGGIRCEEFDEQIQTICGERDKRGEETERNEFGGVGSIEGGGEELEGTIREGKSNGGIGNGRRETTPIGGGIQAIKRFLKNKEFINQFHCSGERERAKKELEEEQAEAAAATGADKEDIQVAEAHASKMAAKWEKIHKKEAKKAEKSKMPQK